MAIFCMCGSCATEEVIDLGNINDENRFDGDLDLDVDDYEVDEIEKAEQCEFDTPYCVNNQLLSCVNGFLYQSTCEEGTRCNYGQCVNVVVNLPKDAGPHDKPIERWQYTGHITDGNGLWGFEISIVKYDRSFFLGEEGTGYTCHVGLTDIADMRHHHIDVSFLNTKTWTASPDVELDLWNCHFYIGGDGNDHIIGEIPKSKNSSDTFVMDLTLEPEKDPTFHTNTDEDQGAVIINNTSNKIYYYSYTRLKATGVLSTETNEYGVSGQVWMDHYWGRYDITKIQGWNWWSIQLDNNYEVMLWRYITLDGYEYNITGTIVDPYGNATTLSGINHFDIFALHKWMSPDTNFTYDLDWFVNIESDLGYWDIGVEVEIQEQEINSIIQSYWFGATRIIGTGNGADLNGVGYTQIMGYIFE